MMIKRINSFQGLRAAAMLLVFFSHIAGVTDLRAVRVISSNAGAAGVSIFIMLSGFLSGMLESDRKISNPYYYAGNKLKKIYRLHLITFLASSFFTASELIRAFDIDSLTKCYLIALTNLSLLQSFIPVKEVYFSYNAVSWYLSDMMLFYFSIKYLNLFFQKFCPKNKNWENAFYRFIITTLILIILVWNLSVVHSSHSHWLAYINPFIRILEFIIGYTLALCRKKSMWGGGPEENYTLWQEASC